MRVTVDVDYSHDLGDLLWGKAYHVYKRIIDEDLGEELLELLENTFDEPDILEIYGFLAYELDVNKFIATNTRLCDIFSIEALMDYANVLGYSKAYNIIKHSDRTDLWEYLVATYYDYTLDVLFSKVIQ